MKLQKCTEGVGILYGFRITPSDGRSKAEKSVGREPIQGLRPCQPQTGWSPWRRSRIKEYPALWEQYARVERLERESIKRYCDRIARIHIAISEPAPE